jgi:NAD(P)-dependent dehydrogenase (short-subunit alcohol dehydrogenase family)
MADRLKGKVAIIVGAGSIGPGWGNGKATAVTFAREGAKVLCVDINAGAAEETVCIIKTEGGEARLFRADVTRSAEVAGMVEACLKAYGRVDVLDNNVGIAAVGGVVEVSEEEWDRVRCGRGRCPWVLGEMPGTSPTPPSISRAMRAVTSRASSSSSMAASR